ncbi:DUF6286 domain-containing protein [Nocardia australiensis]|uniref:DUF6286 domain-containing protein n=1 Tax=Nocardia australiensis TaxID=2887191 RepID=UPI001D14DD52|nr:DUF6286 domain-containing protein [Nocardia australiensis]
MIRRPRRAVPAIVLALVLLAASVAVVVSLVQKLVGVHEFVSYDRVADELHGLTWNEAPVLAAGVVAMVIGVVLLVVALVPGRPVVLPMAAEEGIHAGLTRAGLHAALRHTASSVEGVRTARVRLRRKAVKISAGTDRTDAAGLAEEVCEAVTRRVHELAPEQAQRVRAALHTAKPSKNSRISKKGSLR